MDDTKELEKHLVSSDRIEQIIMETYTKNPKEFKFLQIEKHGITTNGYPLLLTKLKKQIKEIKRLPSVGEFLEYYVSHSLDKKQKSLAKGDALKSVAYKGYLGLVRDFHLFMLLKESGLFDGVISNEEMDLQAKQDIIVRKDGVTMGVQLFSGGADKVKEKLRNANRTRTIQCGYQDYYFPLYNEYVFHKTVELQNGGSVDLYSEEAAKHISDVMFMENPYKYSAPIFPLQYVTPAIPASKVKGKRGKEIRYSLIFVGSAEKLKRKYDLVSLLSQGIIIHFLSTDDLGIEHPSLKSYKLNSVPDELVIVDGEFQEGEAEYLEEISERSDFNYQQFMIEHAPIESQLIINAGAGSGKTTTMISRVMYLLNTDSSITPQDIVMITFTREAADNMRRKIMDSFEKKFQITRDDKYLSWLESSMEMRIMTIDAFSKYLFQNLGSIAGWGQEVKVTSYIHRRREIFQDEFSRYLTECSREDYGYLSEIDDYKLFNYFAEIFDEIMKKGQSLKDSNLEWDSSKGDLRMNALINAAKVILEHTNERMERRKLDRNETTLADIKQQISELKGNLLPHRMDKPIKFLFVDEFQDTDDAQIDLVSTIAVKLEAKLFAVGDIKQSIYRFRGANSTAFHVLVEKLSSSGIEASHYALSTNYRTMKELLNWMEDVFDGWRRTKAQLLPKEIDEAGRDIGRLKPFREGGKSFENPIQIVERKKDVDKMLKEHIGTLYQQLWKGHEKKERGDVKSLAILVRQNWQVEAIGKILEELRSESSAENPITYELSVDGNLFASKSAKHLLILINALRLEGNPESQFALFQTPFIAKKFSMNDLVLLEGNIDQLREEADIRFKSNEANWFFEAQRNLRFEPAMKVLYSLLVRLSFEEVLTLDGEQPHEIIRYRKNIAKIFSEAQKSLGHNADDIQALYEWLKIQVITNRNINEADIMESIENNIIRVMTVHKAKGLEFHTVLIPYTTISFRKVEEDKNKVIIYNPAKESGQRITFRYKWKEGKFPESIASDGFARADSLEGDETDREETRLLYVAMTRAEERLSIIVPKKRDKNLCWAELLQGGEDK